MPVDLRVENVTKHFGDVTAVNGVSFVVGDGEFVSLLGPSGCGKSTILKCLAGLERPDAGTISLGDRVVAGPRLFVPPGERGVAMVFQSYAVWPHMTVFENVAFPLTLRRVKGKEIRERVGATLNMVGLGGLANRYPAQLSGGQQQRVALARSLVYTPALLLLDEPLSNLDAKLREQMRYELKDVQAKLGITTLYVTHDQAEAMAMSDRVVVMLEGKMVQAGTPEALYKQPANRFVAGFLGLSNLVTGKRVGTDDGRWQLALGDGLLLSLPGPFAPADPAHLYVTLRPEGLRLRSDRNPALGPAWESRIQRTLFMGNFVEYWVKLGEAEIRVQGDNDFVFTQGTPVWVHVDEERCRILP